ncbi:MAG: 50S ribosomal protein L29 [Flavobacteriales bacterium]
MKAKDLRNMTEETILDTLKEEKAALAKLKFSHNVAGTENPMNLRHKRREIARMKTILNEKKNSK